MECSVCGTYNNADAAFCYKCGSALKPEAVTGPTVRLSGAQPEHEYTGQGGQPAPPQYPQPYGGYSVPQQSSSALLALILGILSFMGLSLLAAIPAVIVGMKARDEIVMSRGQLTGEGMAQAGIVLGWINIALSVLGFCAFCGPFGIFLGI